MSVIIKQQMALWLCILAPARCSKKHWALLIVSPRLRMTWTNIAYLAPGRGPYAHSHHKTLYLLMCSAHTHTVTHTDTHPEAPGKTKHTPPCFAMFSAPIAKSHHDRLTLLNMAVSRRRGGIFAKRTHHLGESLILRSAREQTCIATALCSFQSNTSVARPLPGRRRHEPTSAGLGPKLAEAVPLLGPTSDTDYGLAP